MKKYTRGQFLADAGNGLAIAANTATLGVLGTAYLADRKKKSENMKQTSDYSYMNSSANFSIPKFSELTPAQKAKLSDKELAYLRKQEEKEQTQQIDKDAVKRASRLRSDANTIVNVSREIRNISRDAGSFGNLLGGFLLNR